MDIHHHSVDQLCLAFKLNHPFFFEGRELPDPQGAMMVSCSHGDIIWQSNDMVPCCPIDFVGRYYYGSTLGRNHFSGARGVVP